MVHDLGNRKIDEYGNVIFNTRDIFSLMLKGYDVLSFSFEQDEEIKSLQDSCFELSNDDLVPKIYTKPTEQVSEIMNAYKNKWNVPDSFMQMDIKGFIKDKCETVAEFDRIEEELAIYEKYELLDVLRVLVYIVETFRKNNVVWGVGRGSSVSSYVLYLIGIHRVNSLKFGLSFSEFLE